MIILVAIGSFLLGGIAGAILTAEIYKHALRDVDEE